MKKRETHRVRIGKAAMMCFEKFGLEKTTLDDIAGAVGLNKASLYYYYKNKEAIFLEVAIKEGEQYLLLLQEKASRKKSTETQLLFYLQERVNYYRHVLNRNKITAASLQKLLPGFFELYDNILEKETAFVAGLLKQGMAQKEIKKTDTLRLATLLINVSDALKHNVEQQSALKNEASADYSAALQDLQLMVQLIFSGLKKH